MGALISGEQEPEPQLWIRVGDVKFYPGGLTKIGRFEYQSKTLKECKELIKNHIRYVNDRITMEYIYMYSLAAAIMIRNNATACLLRNELPFEESCELREIYIENGNKVVYYDFKGRKVIPWYVPQDGLDDYCAEFTLDDLPVLIASMLEQHDSEYKYMVIAMLAWIYAQAESYDIRIALE